MAKYDDFGYLHYVDVESKTLEMLYYSKETDTFGRFIGGIDMLLSLMHSEKFAPVMVRDYSRDVTLPPSAIDKEWMDLIGLMRQ